MMLVRERVESRAAFFGALAIGITSIWFPYSKVEYAESIVTTLLLSMYLLADSYPWIAGLIGGFAVAVRMDAIIWVVITAILAPARRKIWLLRAALAILPGLVLVGWSNFARTGSVLRVRLRDQFRGANSCWTLRIFTFSRQGHVFFSPLLLLYPFRRFDGDLLNVSIA